METTQESQTPQNGAEQTVQTELEALRAELAEAKKKEVELQKQKEHWREKYDRDITSQTPKEPVIEDVFSDEGKFLKKKFENEIVSLSEKVRTFERREAQREIEIEFPILKERKEEFDLFLSDDEVKSLSLRKAAKLFLLEKGLLEQPTERKGLEKPTGGGQKVPSADPSDEELEDIRKHDFRKYEKLIRAGKIK